MLRRIKNIIKFCNDSFVSYWYIRIFLYPLTLLITTPFKLLKTLWNCMVLINGKWSSYSHFNPVSGFLAFFYHRITHCMDKYGRNSMCNELGTGNFSLANPFYYTMPSLYSFKLSSNITVLISMAGWLLSCFLWLDYIQWNYVLIILFLISISTLFYANTFFFQNYNAVGWLFFPGILFALITKKYILLSLFLLLASFGSFTVIVISVIFLVIFFLKDFNVYLIIAFIPAGLKIFFFQVLIMLKGNEVKSFSLNLFKFLGIKKGKAKYKRSSDLNVLFYYFLILILQFIGFTYFVNDKLDILLIASLFIYILNSFIMRFADIQSMFMMLLSVAAVYMINNFNYYLLPSFWLLISPLPFLLGLNLIASKKSFDIVPVLKPFYVRKILDNLGIFIDKIKPGKRILMAYDLPHGNNYRNILEGYKNFADPFLHLTTEKGISCIPDAFSVMENNYENAPELFGKSIEDVMKNSKYWQADYAIISQTESNILETQWTDNKFELVSTLNWKTFKEDLWNTKPYLPAWKDGIPYFKELPVWFLLKVPD